MGYLVDYEALTALQKNLNSQCSNWNSSLSDVLSRASTLEHTDHMKGAAADNIKSYIASIHGSIVESFQKLIELHNANYARYKLDYVHSVDTRMGALIDENELEELKIKVDKQRNAAVEVHNAAEYALQQVRDIFPYGLHSVENVDETHRSVSDYISSVDTQIKHLEQRHSSSDFVNTEQLIAKLEAFLNEVSSMQRTFKSGFTEEQLLKIPSFKGLKDAADNVQKELDEKPELPRDVFDEDHLGQYGGDQGAPRLLPLDSEERRALIDKYLENHPEIGELTDAQEAALLARLNSEGCGYVAMANTIFVQYYGYEEEFEKTFGYQMYKENGELNYNILIMDIYSTMDNRTTSGRIDPLRDYDEDVDGPDKDSYSILNDRTGTGTNPELREYYLEEFMKDRGVNVDMKTNVNVTVDNYQELVDSGKQVLISFHNGNLYDENGSEHPIRGGHSMVVTGVTDDGRLIVSSWGKKYYIKPDEVITVTFSDGSTGTTWMKFETVEYD